MRIEQESLEGKLDRIEAAKVRIREFVDSAEIGSPRLIAVNDFVNREEARADIDSHTDHLRFLSLDPKSIDAKRQSVVIEGRLRQAELRHAQFDSNIADRSVRIPGYKREVGTINGLRVGLTTEYRGVYDQYIAAKHSLEFIASARDRVLDKSDHLQ